MDCFSLVTSHLGKGQNELSLWFLRSPGLRCQDWVFIWTFSLSTLIISLARNSRVRSEVLFISLTPLSDPSPHTSHLCLFVRSDPEEENWNDREISWCCLCWVISARVKCKYFSTQTWEVEELLPPRTAWEQLKYKTEISNRCWLFWHGKALPVLSQGLQHRLSEEAGGGGGCDGVGAHIVCVWLLQLLRLWQVLQVCVWYRGTVVLWYQPTVLPGTDWLARVAWAEVCRGPGLLQVTSPARQQQPASSGQHPGQDSISSPRTSKNSHRRRRIFP